MTDLQTSTALLLEYKQQNLMLQYKKFISQAHSSWSSGRPTLWLAKWKKLINKAKQYDKPLQTWLQDVCLISEQVSESEVENI